MHAVLVKSRFVQSRTVASRPDFDKMKVNILDKARMGRIVLDKDVALKKLENVCVSKQV